MKQWFGKSLPVRPPVRTETKDADSKMRVSTGYALAAELCKNRIPPHLLHSYKDTVGWEQQGPQGRLHARLALFELAQSIAKRNDVSAEWWRLLDEHLPVPKAIWTQHLANEDAGRHLSSYKEQGERARAKIDSLQLERDNLRTERDDLQQQLHASEDVLDEQAQYVERLEQHSAKLQGTIDYMKAAPDAPLVRRPRPGSGIISAPMAAALASMGAVPEADLAALSEAPTAQTARAQHDIV